MVKIIYVTNPNLLDSKLKELNKILVVGENLHGIKIEFFRGCGGDLEMIGKI